MNDTPDTGGFSAPLLAERRRRIRSALTASVITGLIVFLVPLAVGVFTHVWAVAAAMYVYFRRARGDKIVLWLRRFHEKEPKRFRFNQILNGAGRGLFSAITIQDSVFKTSYYSSILGSVLMIPLVFGVGMLILMLVAVATLGTLSFVAGLDSTPLAIVTITVVVLVGVLYAYGVWRFLISRGFKTLPAEAAVQKCGELLARISNRRGPLAGVSILKCGDEVWQKVVKYCLERADALIIDVSDINENMMWELKNAYELLPAAAIILVCKEEDAAARARGELPGTVRKVLGQLLGSEAFSNSPVLLYPPRLPRPGRERAKLYRTMSRNLIDVIVKAVEAKLPVAA